MRVNVVEDLLRQEVLFTRHKNASREGKPVQSPNFVKKNLRIKKQKVLSISARIPLTLTLDIFVDRWK